MEEKTVDHVMTHCDVYAFTSAYNYAFPGSWVLYKQCSTGHGRKTINMVTEK